MKHVAGRRDKALAALRRTKNVCESMIQPLDEARRAPERRRQPRREMWRALHGLDNPLVRRDVGSPKPIDRLLRITHDRELAWRERHGVRGRGLRAVLAQEQHDLRLERIGVLELVDEDVIEQRLARAADRAVIA